MKKKILLTVVILAGLTTIAMANNTKSHETPAKKTTVEKCGAEHQKKSGGKCGGAEKAPVKKIVKKEMKCGMGK